MFNMKKIGLLPRIVIAIALGLSLGRVAPTGVARLCATFNGIFSQFLGFVIPLIIVGLVTPAISEVGKNAGKLLLATAGIAYFDTILAALLAYGTGSALFPKMVSDTLGGAVAEKSTAIAPFFEMQIPPLCDVMSALAISFMLGLGIAYGKSSATLRTIALEFRDIVEKTIGLVIIPLLPFYILGLFMTMSATGEAFRIVLVFAKIIAVIFALHILVMLYEFAIAGALTRRNPLKLMCGMFPAYMTALGTSSSAATIPVTLAQTRKLGVSEEVAGFTVPLCATIHLSGSAMKITACALTICLMKGTAHGFGTFLHFVMMLGVVMVAAPGVPGGAIMAALGLLGSILGFTSENQALMIALYIAMDSFGTACNVTGDGAIALVIDKFHHEGGKPTSAQSRRET